MRISFFIADWPFYHVRFHAGMLWTRSATGRRSDFRWCLVRYSQRVFTYTITLISRYNISHLAVGMGDATMAKQALTYVRFLVLWNYNSGCWVSVDFNLFAILLKIVLLWPFWRTWRAIAESLHLSIHPMLWATAFWSIIALFASTPLIFLSKYVRSCSRM